MADQLEKRGLMLSVDARPRLKWTLDLHQRFVSAVHQLGGVDKATPKSVMRVMGISGLTLYHLKSHLQKYRLAKHRDHSNNCSENRKLQIADMSTEDEKRTSPQVDETMLRIQMEVQRKLQEQIEVQRHLQLRIEAQGKYLQSVLRKAQETLAGYSSNSMGMEAAQAELSELVSTVETECLSSSISGGCFGLKQYQHADCSADSCLTSSDSPPEKQEIKLNIISNLIEESDEINPNCSHSKRSCSKMYEEGNGGNRVLHQEEEEEDSLEKGVEIDLNL